MGSESGIMRHQHQRGAFAPVEFQQYFEHLLSRSAIQIAGGLVGEQNGGPGDEGAGQRHALLLTAGELNGIMIQAVGQTYPGQQFARPLRRFRPRARQFGRQQHIFLRRQRGYELERLKNEANLAPPHFRHAVFGKARDIFPIQQQLAAGGCIEARQQPEERAFPAAGGPHYGHELSSWNGQIDAAQDLHSVGGRDYGSREPDDFDDGSGIAAGHWHDYGSPAVMDAFALDLGFSRSELVPKSRPRSSDIMMAMRVRLFLTLAALAALPVAAGNRTPASRSDSKSTRRSRTSAGASVNPDNRPVIVAFGDSLTAGFGLEPGRSYPDLLQRQLDAEGYRYRVVNLGVSGDTTTDGVERLPTVLALRPAIVIVEFGANDGLRGQPVTAMRQNLTTIVESIQKTGAAVLLAGMTLPRNYGPEYIDSFERVYLELAKKYKLQRLPFLLDGVGGHADLTQPDGLHPTAQGTDIVEHTVMKYLMPLLHRETPAGIGN